MTAPDHQTATDFTIAPTQVVCRLLPWSGISWKNTATTVNGVITRQDSRLALISIACIPFRFAHRIHRWKGNESAGPEKALHSFKQNSLCQESGIT
jgi:hypothetical protein